MLIGDISKAFSNVAEISGLGVVVHTNMLDGIDSAASNGFAVIAVVMSGSSAKLSSALKVLRETDSEAMIILLAQMYQESLAIQLVASERDGVSLADDYLICPIQTDRFCQSIEPGGSERQGATEAPPAALDAATVAKIRELEELATTDELTGLKNRRYILEFCRQIIGHAKETNGRVTLLMFDIDDFKHYNDVYGHSAGDDILKQAAVLMRYCCRSHDVVGRIGGDEFAVIFWDDPYRKSPETETERRTTAADHPKEAIFIAKRFRRELKRAELPLLGAEGKGVLAISGGLASFPRDGATVQELFQRADEALLDAKRSGKNRIYLVGREQSDIADIK